MTIKKGKIISLEQIKELEELVLLEIQIEREKGAKYIRNNDAIWGVKPKKKKTLKKKK